MSAFKYVFQCYWAVPFILHSLHTISCCVFQCYWAGPLILHSFHTISFCLFQCYWAGPFILHSSHTISCCVFQYYWAGLFILHSSHTISCCCFIVIGLDLSYYTVCISSFFVVSVLLGWTFHITQFAYHLLLLFHCYWAGPSIFCISSLFVVSVLLGWTFHITQFAYHLLLLFHCYWAGPFILHSLHIISFCCFSVIGLGLSYYTVCISSLFVVSVLLGWTFHITQFAYHLLLLFHCYWAEPFILHSLHIISFCCFSVIGLDLPYYTVCISSLFVVSVLLGWTFHILHIISFCCFSVIGLDLSYYTVCIPSLVVVSLLLGWAFHITQFAYHLFLLFQCYWAGPSILHSLHIISFCCFSVIGLGLSYYTVCIPSLFVVSLLLGWTFHITQFAYHLFLLFQCYWAGPSILHSLHIISFCCFSVIGLDLSYYTVCVPSLVVVSLLLGWTFHITQFAYHLFLLFQCYWAGPFILHSLHTISFCCFIVIGLGLSYYTVCISSLFVVSVLLGWAFHITQFAYHLLLLFHCYWAGPFILHSLHIISFCCFSVIGLGLSYYTVCISSLFVVSVLLGWTFHITQFAYHLFLLFQCYWAGPFILHSLRTISCCCFIVIGLDLPYYTVCISSLFVVSVLLGWAFHITQFAYHLFLLFHCYWAGPFILHSLHIISFCCFSVIGLGLSYYTVCVPSLVVVSLLLGWTFHITQFAYHLFLLFQCYWAGPFILHSLHTISCCFVSVIGLGLSYYIVYTPSRIVYFSVIGLGHSPEPLWPP